MWAGVACAATGLTVAPAAAEALLVIEADSGKVIFAHNAGQPWYPASTTKLMTTYVTLRAVKEGASPSTGRSSSRPTRRHSPR
jgi:D-alanyl-D-alanine carboxypeptidase